MEYGKRRGDGEDGEEQKERVDGMAIAEGGVGEIVDERIEDGEEGDGKCVGIFGASEEPDAGQSAEGEKHVGENDHAGELRIGVEKIVDGMFGAGPGGDDSSCGEAQE